MKLSQARCRPLSQQKVASSRPCASDGRFVDQRPGGSREYSGSSAAGPTIAVCCHPCPRPQCATSLVAASGVSEPTRPKLSSPWQVGQRRDESWFMMLLALVFLALRFDPGSTAPALVSATQSLRDRPKRTTSGCVRLGRSYGPLCPYQALTCSRPHCSRARTRMSAAWRNRARVCVRCPTTRNQLLAGVPRLQPTDCRRDRRFEAHLKRFRRPDPALDTSRLKIIWRDCTPEQEIGAGEGTDTSIGRVCAAKHVVWYVRAVDKRSHAVKAAAAVDSSPAPAAASSMPSCVGGAGVHDQPSGDSRPVNPDRLSVSVAVTTSHPEKPADVV